MWQGIIVGEKQPLALALVGNKEIGLFRTEEKVLSSISLKQVSLGLLHTTKWWGMNVA